MTFSFGQPNKQPTGLTPSSSTFSFSSLASNTPTTQPIAVVGPLQSGTPAATATGGGGLFGGAATGGGLFGATSTTGTTGGLFGSPASAGTAVGGSLFTGQAVSSTAGGGLFGAVTPATAGTTGGLFGTGTTPAATSTTGGLFGAKPAASTGTSLFGGPTPATNAVGFSFASNPAVSVAQPGGLFGTSTAAPGSLFGATGSTGLFGATKTTAAAPLFGAANTSILGSTTSSLFGNTTQPAATTATFKGLGGSDTATSTTGATTSAVDPKLSKESAVPNELIQQIETFKQNIAEEKKFRDEISKQSSAKPLFVIQNDIVTLRNQTVLVHSLIQKCLNYANTIKSEFSQELRNFDMISRVKDTPVSLQDRSFNPISYFLSKVEIFTEQIINISDQLQIVERYLAQRNDFITAEDFSMGLRRINEAFVALVARYQEIQERVSHLKTDYLQYRKHVHQDLTNVFEVTRKKNAVMASSMFSPSKIIQSTTGDTSAIFSTVGPSPFTMTSSTSGSSVISAQTGTTGLGQTNFGSSLLPSTGLSTFGSTLTPVSTALVKPGTKRNKSK